MTEERFLDRNKQFLQFDSQQFTHSRHENIVDLRKKKRSQHLAKRRAINSNMTDRLDFDGNEILVVEQMNDILLDFCPDLGKEDLDDLSKLAIIKQIIENNPPINILDLAIFTVRHIISRKHGPPIGAFLNIGYGKLLIGLLDYKYGQNIPLEAAWSICNLLSGPHEYAEVLYKLDVIPALMRITCPESPLVSEHTL